MDKHCAAVKDWRREGEEDEEGEWASEEEWCLHLCFRGSDQCGGKYHHRLPSPPPTPTHHPSLWLLKPFESPLCTAELLCSPLGFLHGRVLHSRKGEGGRSLLRQRTFPTCLFQPWVDRPPARRTNPHFSQAAKQGSGMLFAFGRRTAVVSFHHPPFSASSKKKSDPCNPVVYCQRPELPPSRWLLRGSIFYIDVTQEHERVTPQSEKNGFRGARFGAPSQTQLVCTTPCWGIIASARSFDCARCSLSALFWISDSRETIYWCWWKKRPWSLRIWIFQSLWRRWGRKMFHFYKLETESAGRKCQKNICEELVSWQTHLDGRWFRAPCAYGLI